MSEEEQTPKTRVAAKEERARGVLTDDRRGWLSNINYARLRCQATSSLIQRVRGFDRTPPDSSVVSQLLERDLTERQKALLSRALWNLLRRDSEADADERPKLDRVFLRLSGMVNRGDARRMAIEMISSKRRLRRETAYRILRRVGVTAKEIGVIQRACRASPDREGYRLLALTRRGFRNLEVNEVMLAVGGDRLARISDWYWEARAIERFVRDGDARPEDFRASWPIALVRAMGRLGDRKRSMLVLEIAREVRTPEVISLAASVLGRLRDLAAIERLEHIASEIAADSDI